MERLAVYLAVFFFASLAGVFFVFTVAPLLLALGLAYFALSVFAINFHALFSRRGFAKLTDSLFYGSLMVLFFDQAGVSLISLNNSEKVVFFIIVLLIKPLQKFKIKL